MSATLIAGVLAWGALAFGAVYPWAYWPLVVAAGAMGASGLWRRSPAVAGDRGCAVAFGCVLAAVLIQLIPLTAGVIGRVAPATDRFLRAYDITYADAGATHPLSINPSSTIGGFAFGASFGLLLFGVHRHLRRTSIRVLAVRITQLGVLLAFIGVVQQATFNGKLYGFWQPINPGANSFGPFVNRNHFAGWMLMALPVSLGLFCGFVARGVQYVQPDWRSRIVWFSSPAASRAMLTGFGVLVMALSVALTLSRSGMACLAVAVLVAGWRTTASGMTWRRRTLVVAFLILLGVVAVSWAGADVIGNRFFELAGTGAAATRVSAWRDALTVTREFWLTGTGLNTYGTATLLYQTSFLKFHFAEAHNDYLQLAAEGGLLVGLPALVCLSLFVVAIRRALATPSEDVVVDWVRRGAATGLLAIGLQETVDFSLQMPGNAVLFVVLCAIAMWRPT